MALPIHRGGQVVIRHCNACSEAFKSCPQIVIMEKYISLYAALTES